MKIKVLLVFKGFDSHYFLSLAMSEGNNFQIFGYGQYLCNTLRVQYFKALYYTNLLYTGEIRDL